MEKQKNMRVKNVLIICITAILCISIISATVLILNNQNSKNNNTIKNVSLNTTNATQNNTTTTTTTKKTTTKKKTDPNYDASRDKSHQYATKDHPITVQQSDGEYTYYGPGHYDYYAGGNHMSGEYYKEKNKNSY